MTDNLQREASRGNSYRLFLSDCADKNNPQKYLIMAKQSEPNLSKLNLIRVSSAQMQTDSLTHLFLQQAYSRESAKRKMYQDYQQNVKIKNAARQFQRLRTVELQKKILEKNLKLHNQIIINNIAKKKAYQKQVTEDYQQKLRQKQIFKVNQEHEKTQWNKQFQNKKITDKNSFFKQFYKNCQQQMKYNSQLYLQNHQKFCRQNNPTNLQRAKNVKGNYRFAAQNNNFQTDTLLGKSRYTLGIKNQQEPLYKRHDSLNRLEKINKKFDHMQEKSDSPQERPNYPHEKPNYSQGKLNSHQGMSNLAKSGSQIFI